MAQLITDIFTAKEDHQSALLSHSKIAHAQNALTHFLALKDLCEKHHQDQFSANIHQSSTGATLTLSLLDDNHHPKFALSFDYDNFLDEDISDLLFDTQSATGKTKALLEDFNRSIIPPSSSEPAFNLDALNLSNIHQTNRSTMMDALNISAIHGQPNSVNLSALNLSNITAQSTLEEIESHDRSIFNLQKALGEFKDNENSAIYLREALSRLNEDEHSVQDLNRALLNNTANDDGTVFSLTQALAQLDDDDNVVFNLQAAMDQLAPTNISIIELDSALSKMTAFNAHYAPGDMLMSTKRPSGNLTQYVHFLKEQGIGTLISIGANESPTLPAILAESGIQHIDDSQFHIEDFLDDGQLPASKLKAITDKINSLESQGIKVAIHCGAGDGRSGVVKSAYVLSQLSLPLPTSTTDTITTHYHGTKIVTASKAVCDAVRSVRSDGHELAVERPADITALQTFYSSLVNK
ncbi:dual specificity protein phosphatase family protein [uncultured Shewanella sp.]|uniref:protein-tyrosine phosphatase family protein n=1 Tax=uncultured Shewanella sp. TaxID=173975 RepID=UPI00262EEAE4|nr:dual specificity protein phosphatase family protein [uncultured Shewanella sp.]